MPELDPPWVLENFLERLDRWIDQEGPPEQVRVVATSWILTRIERPYDGVRREPSFENLWFGVVPGSLHGGGRVAVCSYWIFERNHRLRCDSFASLSWPA